MRHDTLYRNKLFIPGRIFTIALIVLYLLAALVINAPRAQAASNSQYFPQTGFTVSGKFLTYWQDHGGLPVFGYPITDAHLEVDPTTNKTFTTQWFERNRFELHEENVGTPYEVLLGLLGSQITVARHDETPFQPISAFTSTATDTYFSPTRHSLSGGFKTYWEAHGGLAQFGYPISEPFQETTIEGTYTVQYFERARYEYHPNNQPPYDVLLGLLGNQITYGAGGTALQLKQGNVSTKIAPDQTALFPSSITTTITGVLRARTWNDPQTIKVRVVQPAGSDWVVQQNATPDGASYAFTLSAQHLPSSYLDLEITHGQQNPITYFSIEIVSGQPGLQPLLNDHRQPVHELMSYYNAINRGEYQRAYSYWRNPGTSATSLPPDYSDFVNGYSSTASVSIITRNLPGDHGAGNIYYPVPVVITSNQTDGTTQRYYGCYVLHQQNIESGDSFPPYWITIDNAHILSASLSADQNTLLDQATTMANNGQCLSQQ